MAIDSSPPLTASASPGLASLRSTLQLLAGNLAGISPAEIPTDTAFLDLGVDSLMLIQFTQAIEQRFDIKIPFRMLIEELTTIEFLSQYLDRHAPAHHSSRDTRQPTPQANDMQVPTQQPGAANLESALPMVQRGEPGDQSLMRNIDQLFGQQLQIISQQLEILRSAGLPAGGQLEQPSVPARTPAASAPAPQTTQGHSGQPANGRTPYVPYRPINPSAANDLTPAQQRHLDALIERYTRRTRASKHMTQAYRPYLADSRTTSGFRLQLKELLYPIVVERAAAARVWDLDGNEYVDIAMGYGSLLFGHSPAFLVQTLEEHLRQGIRIGPQSHLVGQTAQLICELTGMERAAFCNSGTEAVMSALRLARTATGRSLVALFAGSYHGTFDGVLARAQELPDGSLRAVPMCPGVPAHMLEDVIILRLDDPKSLDTIKAHAHELAAVLVEPQQSRRPDLQPEQFLRELRHLTAQMAIPLIFDEVITGFRAHPGGIQGLLGLQADISIYGKALGGGLPIGVIAGKAAYLDAIDGGMWSYGDTSYPHATQTLFAGTYFKHPLVMAGALAVLRHLKQSGPKLQDSLNRRTSQLAETLNTYFTQSAAPVRIAHFSSLFLFTFPADFKHSDLFFYHLAEKGVYTWEGRTCFLSTAHTDQDIAQIIRAVQDSVKEMQAGEFFPSSPEPAPGGSRNGARHLPSHTTVHQTAPSLDAPVAGYAGAPLTESQKELWVLARMGPEVARAYTLTPSVDLRGPLDIAALRQAVQGVVDRHEALRTVFDLEGREQHAPPELILDIPLIDFSSLEPTDRDASMAGLFEEIARQPFDLLRGPLFRSRIVRFEEQWHQLALALHHIIADGVSIGIVLGEISALYAALRERAPAGLPRPGQFSDYARRQADQSADAALQRAEAYWLGQFRDPPAPLDLPTDRPRTAAPTYSSGRAQITIAAPLCENLRLLSKRQGCTLFMTLLAGFQALLHRLSGQHDIVVGIPSLGRSAVEDGYLIGHCVNLLPLRSQLTDSLPFDQYLANVKRHLFDAYEQQIYPQRRLIQKLKLDYTPGRAPLAAATFNLERSSTPTFAGLEVAVQTQPPRSTYFDLNVNITETEQSLRVDCDYRSEYFDATTIQRWLGHFQTLLESMVARPSDRVVDLALLTDTEQRRILLDWNAIRQPYPQDVCVHGLVAAQAQRWPAAVAVEDAGQALSYAELNTAANRLAWLLRRYGVGVETRVAVCLERSPALVITLLGILKAGGAYVPIDPSYPLSRQTWMLADAQALVLLTSSALAERFSGAPTRVLALEALAAQLEREPTHAPLSAIAPDRLAYVI
jgi:glutamate-1-semialdehyde aminotransferase/acyl carrier protein